MSLQDQLDDAIGAGDAPTVKALLSGYPELVHGPDGVRTPPLNTEIGANGNLTVDRILLTRKQRRTKLQGQSCNATQIHHRMYAVTDPETPSPCGGGHQQCRRRTEPAALAENLPNDEMRDIGITRIRSQYEEIARMLKGAGA